MTLATHGFTIIVSHLAGVGCFFDCKLSSVSPSLLSSAAWAFFGSLLASGWGRGGLQFLSRAEAFMLAGERMSCKFQKQTSPMCMSQATPGKSSDIFVYNKNTIGLTCFGLYFGYG